MLIARNGSLAETHGRTIQFLSENLRLPRTEYGHTFCSVSISLRGCSLTPTSGTVFSHFAESKSRPPCPLT